MLFEAVKGFPKRVVLRAAVQGWLARFRKKPRSAQVELLNFFFEACGVGGRQPVATGLDVRDVDMQDLVAKLSVVERAVGGKLLSVYPCATNAPNPLRKFRANFTEFIDKFVAEGGAELISNGVLQQLVEWLTVIASSSWAPFRHTAALATGQLVKSLIKEVLHRASKDLNKRQRQALAEEKKNGGAQTDRSRDLRAQIDRTKQLISVAERDVVIVAFNSLFMHLYRDSRAVVRADLLKFYGAWVALCPKIFLKDQRTKYLGWMLHDSDAGVRVNAVRALDQVYRSAGANLAKLQNFTLRFKRRIVEMIQDTDANVACEVFALLGTLFGQGVLSEEDIFAACDAVFVLSCFSKLPRARWNDARKLSSTAARFALSAVSGLRHVNGDSRDNADGGGAMRRIRAFEAFVVDHACHGSAAGGGSTKDTILRLCDCAVDAFWDHVAGGEGACFLVNWKSMVLLLLADSGDAHSGGKGDGCITSTDSRVLLRILCSCAKRACFPADGARGSADHPRTCAAFTDKIAAGVNDHQKEISRELVDARDPVNYICPQA